MKDLPLSNDIVKTRIKEVTDRVADLAEKCKELQKDDLHAFEEKVVTISADASTVKSTLAEQAAAVNWKLKQTSSKMRSEYQTKGGRLASLRSVSSEAGICHGMRCSWQRWFRS